MGPSGGSAAPAASRLDKSGAPVAMVGVGADITGRKLAEERLQFLVRAGELLGSSLDLDTTLQQLCDLAIERLGDWCSVDLLDSGGVRLVAVSHRDPDKVTYARQLRERFGVNLDDDQGLAEGAPHRAARGACQKSTNSSSAPHSLASATSPVTRSNSLSPSAFARPWWYR